jgi:RimJ/RimL family protein N-acetyltransferase
MNDSPDTTTALRCPDASSESARRQARVVFETDHVVVRPISLRTFRDLRTVAAVPEIRRNLFHDTELTDDRLKMFTRYWRRQWFLTGASHWMAYGATGELLGICGFERSTIVEGLEVVIAVLPNVRGTAGVVRLYRAMLDYGFSVLEQPAFYALCVVGHPSARRFGEKEGSVFVRTIEVAPGWPMDFFQISPASVAAARAARPVP